MVILYYDLPSIKRKDSFPFAKELCLRPLRLQTIFSSWDMEGFIFYLGGVCDESINEVLQEV